MTDATNRTRIIDALIALLATEPLERIGLDDIAKTAGLSLADLRGEFSSVVAILAAHMKDIDRKVLSADTSDMTEEPARERLFDVLMRRLDALYPQYGFSSHVGYITATHDAAVRAHGPCPQHRRSFNAKAYVGPVDGSSPPERESPSASSSDTVPAARARAA